MSKFDHLFDHLTITDDWNGEGLPPIGERVGVNSLHPKNEYETAIVVGHMPQRGELIAVYVLEDRTDWSWSSFGLDDGDSQAFIPWVSVSTERLSA